MTGGPWGWSTTKENIFPPALMGRWWQAGGTTVGLGRPWDQLLCTGAGRMPGGKGICGGGGDCVDCCAAQGGCGLGQGSGPLIHGKETCGADERVGGRCGQLGAVSAFVPAIQLLPWASAPKPLPPGSPPRLSSSVGRLPTVGHLALGHHHFPGTAFMPAALPRGPHAVSHLTHPALCHEPEAEQDPAAVEILDVPASL